MKNHFKTILYFIPLFACLNFGFPCFASDSGFAWGQDVLTGSNGSANINSLLGDTYSFESLFSPGFVVGISNAYDELNYQLYDRFGWDLDDAGQKIIDVASGGGDELGLTLNILAQTINSPATDILSGGYQLFQFVRSGGAKSLVLGLADQANTTLEKIKGTILNQITADDIDNIVDSIGDLKQSGVIYNNSDSVFLYDDFVSDSYYSAHLAHNVYMYNYDGFIGIVTPDSNLGASGSFRYTHGTFEYDYTVISPNYAQFSSRVINGVTYYYGMLYIKYNVYNITLDRTTTSTLNFHTDISTTFNDIVSYLTNNTGLSEDIATSTDFVDNSHYQDILDLLDSLKGHWVDTASLSSIRDLLDGGVITQDDTTGEFVYEFDDTLVDSLADIINDILDRSQVIEGELEDVISDSGTADPDDPVDPDNPVDYTGVIVPDNFPTGVFNPLFKVFDLPLDFFSFFEPLFYVFGSFSGLFALWTFVPIILIILLFVWALK